MKPPKYCTIYLVRHGETQWNIEGRIQGHLDSPLTNTGVAQAKEAATRLKSIHFAAAFSSDSLRAHRTAKIIAKEHRLIVNTTKLLRERNFGNIEGRLWEEVKQELGDLFQIKNSLPESERPTFLLTPDSETDEVIVSRMLTFLRETAVAYLGKTVLAVSHGGMIRTLLKHLGFGNDQQLKSGAIGNTAHIVLRSDGVDFFIDETQGITLSPDH